MCYHEDIDKGKEALTYEKQIFVRL
jgi:hypothetical protein